MALESGFTHGLVQFAEGIGAVLVVLAQTARLSVLKDVGGIFQMLEAVGLHRENAGEVLLGEGDMICGEISAGERVGIGAGPLA